MIANRDNLKEGTRVKILAKGFGEGSFGKVVVVFGLKDEYPEGQVSVTFYVGGRPYDSHFKYAELEVVESSHATTSAVKFSQPAYEALDAMRRSDVDQILAAALDKTRTIPGYKVHFCCPAVTTLQEAIAQYVTNIKDHI